MGWYPDTSTRCTCDTPTGSENRRCSYCKQENDHFTKVKKKVKRKKKLKTMKKTFVKSKKIT